jgi:hypothetical protein
MSELDLKPLEVGFLEVLNWSKNTIIFKVTVHGKIYVMKVVRPLLLLLTAASLSVSSIMIEADQIGIQLTARSTFSFVNQALIGG